MFCLSQYLTWFTQGVISLACSLFSFSFHLMYFLAPRFKEPTSMGREEGGIEGNFVVMGQIRSTSFIS